MQKKYDLIIVGMGPSGVFCAYELIQKNKHKNILLIEQGRSIEKRGCPIEKTGKCVHCKPFCSITCGFSGAGAFSDGKVNSYHLATGVPDNLYMGGNDGPSFRQALSVDEIKSLFAYTDDIYLKFGASPELTGVNYKTEIEAMQKKARKENLDLIYFPIRHLGTEKAHLLYSKIQSYLQENNVEMIFDTIVSDLVIEDNKVKGVKTVSAYTKDQEQIFYADNVCLAVGRKGADWLSKMCKKYNIKNSSGAVDIGVRYELPDEVMKEVNKYFYEAKFIGYPNPFCDKVRAFCQNPSGFVATEVYDNNLTLVNGHSYKDKKSTNTNLAILVSHKFTHPFDKPIQYGINVAENVNQLGAGNLIVQRLGDIYRGKRTWDYELKNNKVEPTLKSAVAGDLTYVLGYRTMTDILQFIRSVDKVVEGFGNPENLLYAPEIKFYSNEIVLDKEFMTSVENLYAIGDGPGQTTGLIMSSAAGVQLARFLDKKF
ncbi:MAG: FAD-dependent oxidoreductase [Clostridia bacterium]|nr:FAD-dependent oxidoreductase [Clostridia bacterium]